MTQPPATEPAGGDRVQLEPAMSCGYQSATVLMSYPVWHGLELLSLDTSIEFACAVCLLRCEATLIAIRDEELVCATCYGHLIREAENEQRPSPDGHVASPVDHACGWRSHQGGRTRVMRSPRPDGTFELAPETGWAVQTANRNCFRTTASFLERPSPAISWHELLGQPHTYSPSN